MTLDEFGNLIGTVDPGARHYTTAARGAFTTWAEYSRLDEYSDGQNDGGWKIQVERYTQRDHDPIAEALNALFSSREDISYTHQVDTEGDGESLTIRHLFDCEVL